MELYKISSYENSVRRMQNQGCNGICSEKVKYLHFTTVLAFICGRRPNGAVSLFFYIAPSTSFLSNKLKDRIAAYIGKERKKMKFIYENGVRSALGAYC